MEIQSFDIINSAGKKSVDIRLFRPIGAMAMNGVDGAQVAEEIAYLSGEYENINIHINSHGGSVMDGMSILSSMMDSKAYITVYVKGLAASIAHVFSQAADHVVMADYSLMMMHDPAVNGGGGDPEVLERFKSALVSIYSNRTGLEASQISEMMANQTWMNATEAKNFGFADEILVTEKRNKAIKNEMDPMDLFLIVNQLEQKTKSIKMKDVLNHLALGEETTEKEVINAIEVIQGEVTAQAVKIEGLDTDLTAKDAKIEDLENKLQGFEDAEVTRIDNEATELVEKAIADKRISNEVREKWLDFAKNDLAGTKEVLNAISVNPKLSKITEDGEKPAEKYEGTTVQNVMSEIDEK